MASRFYDLLLFTDAEPAMVFSDPESSRHFPAALNVDHVTDFIKVSKATTGHADSEILRLCTHVVSKSPKARPHVSATVLKRRQQRTGSHVL